MLRYRILDEYPSEPYTDVYWVKFVDISAARVAKRKLDDRSFFGKNLHVSYAPEFESVEETREKLQQRKDVIAQKTKGTCIMEECFVLWVRSWGGASDLFPSPPPSPKEHVQWSPSNLGPMSVAYRLSR